MADEHVAEGLGLLAEVTEALVTQQIALLTQWQADSITTETIPEASEADFSAIVERLQSYQQRLAEYQRRLSSRS